MPSLHQRKGTEGERIAERWLKRKGYRVLERNARAWKFGELDLVCRLPAGRQAGEDMLVFVEVKTRRSARFGSPEEAVSPWKLERIGNAAAWYLQARGLAHVPHRIDVLAVDLTGSKPVIRHLRSVS